MCPAVHLLQVYKFNVPTFGPGVVFDVNWKIRSEQIRFFADSLRTERLKGYVPQFTMEIEVAPHPSACNGVPGRQLVHTELQTRQSDVNADHRNAAPRPSGTISNAQQEYTWKQAPTGSAADTRCSMAYCRRSLTINSVSNIELEDEGPVIQDVRSA